MTPRFIAERFFRDRILRRRLPERFGRRSIYVSPDAALRWLRPGETAFDSVLLNLADQFVAPGDVVWDIGANVGAFAFPAAHRSRAFVLAVEADMFLASALQQSAAHPDNADLDIRVLCAAVGDHDGVARFRIAGRGRAANGLETADVSTQHGNSRAVSTVPLLTLDTLLTDMPPPQLIKVDIEGGELMLLAGARKILNDIRPIIFIEVTSASWPEARALLTNAGYRLYDADQPLPDLAPAGDDACNVLAMPVHG